LKYIPAHGQSALVAPAMCDDAPGAEPSRARVSPPGPGADFDHGGVLQDRRAVRSGRIEDEVEQKVLTGCRTLRAERECSPE